MRYPISQGLEKAATHPVFFMHGYHRQSPGQVTTKTIVTAGSYLDNFRSVIVAHSGGQVHSAGP